MLDIDLEDDDKNDLDLSFKSKGMPFQIVYR